MEACLRVGTDRPTFNAGVPFRVAVPPSVNVLPTGSTAFTSYQSYQLSDSPWLACQPSFSICLSFDQQQCTGN